MAKNYKKEDLDFDTYCYGDDTEAYTVFEGKAIAKWNKKKKLYKLWSTKRHTKLLKNINLWEDFAKENNTVYRCIMFLMDYVDTGNMLKTRNNYDNIPTPITSELQLMKLLKVGRSTWYKIVKPALFDKISPVLARIDINMNGEKLTFFFMNPLICVDWQGISIPCYSLFKNCIFFLLKDTDDGKCLEKHAQECDIGNLTWFGISEAQQKHLNKVQKLGL